MTGFPCLAAVVAHAVLPHPAAPKALQLNGLFGVKAGVFYPSSQALRDVMGGQWFSFGITRIRGTAQDKARIVTDLELIRHTDGDNKVAMLSPSISLLKDFGEPGSNTYPYVAVGVGLTYFDYTLRNGAFRDSTKRIGPSMNLQAGYVFDGKFFISARYNLMPTYDGYGFSGLTLSVGYGFIKF